MLGDTQKLVECCIKRNRKAWEQFIKRFSGLLYYSAAERLKRNGILFGQQDLQDIVQGVLLELWERRRLEEVRERGRIKAWLSIVAQTRALNYMVRKKERLLSEEDFFRLDNLKADEPKDQGEDLFQALESLIRELAPREKLILKMNILHKKTHREIAGFMRLPVNTVSTIIAREKKSLGEKLKKLKENRGGECLINRGDFYELFK
ncbi:MAG: sigma-70 family RNA polymerase sigma factor [Candidatus Omnitrophota bacterium]